jgi:surface protein
MGGMFANATSFNQNLGSWNIISVTDMNGMLNSCGMSSTNYDSTLCGWSLLPTLQTGVLLGALGLFYSPAGLTCRNILTGTYSWVITGDNPLVVTPFVSNWDTTQTSGGSSLANQVQLPLDFSGTYNFTVDWGDGSPIDTITVWNDPLTLHTYGVSGTYTITITGQIEGFRFNNTGDRDKLLNITSWGPNFRLGNNNSYFYGCTNLDLSFVSDILDLTGTISMTNTFRDCTSLTTVNNMNLWDTSSIVSMSSMFRNATSFNQPIGTWDTSSVTTMGSMFNNATLFNQPIGTWITSLVTNMTLMFAGATSFNQPIGTWDVSSVITINAMFDTAISFNQPIGTWDVSNITDMSGMFQSATSFNQPIGTWNTSLVTNMISMFNNATLFNQPIGTWDVSLVTSMNNMLDNCGLSQANYDNLLIGWSILPSLQLGVTLGALNIQYTQPPSAVALARNTVLIGTYGWTIVGDIPVP